MAKPDKAAAIAELTDKFRSSGAAVLTEYRGLTVAQLTAAAQRHPRARHLRRGEEHAHRDRCQGGRSHGLRRPAPGPLGHRLRHR